MERDWFEDILRGLVHQVDPQTTGPMANKAVSPGHRAAWLHEARRALGEAS